MTDAGLGGEEASRTPRGGEGDCIAALWLATLQDVAARGAHDLKNALNAVAVNLEVARSRSARGSAGAEVAPFVATAARELEEVTARAEALLSLARAPQVPGDVCAVLRELARALGDTDGGPLLHVAPAGESLVATTPVDPALMRMVLARAVLSISRDVPRVTCEVRRAEGILVRVSAEGARPEPLAAGVLAIASEHAVQIVPTSAGYDIHLPSTGPDETNRS